MNILSPAVKTTSFSEFCANLFMSNSATILPLASVFLNSDKMGNRLDTSIPFVPYDIDGNYRLDSPDLGCFERIE